MNLLLAIPMEVRLVALFVLGVCAAGLANLAVYRLAWSPRRISPWSQPEPDAPPRRPADRIPVLGWLGLRREAPLFGPGFWVRPMLVELLVGFGFAWLYWWEIDQKALLPMQLAVVFPAAWMPMLHAQYGCHLVLIWLMLVASLIDADEKIIPDTITVPGTLLGLLLAAAYPWSMLPVRDVQLLPGGGFQAQDWFLQLTSPLWCGHWPTWLHGYPHAGSLVLGLGCWWLWCVGLMPRSWYTRHGYCRAVALSWARLRRESATRNILVMGLAGSVPIAGVWVLGEMNWGAANGLWVAWVGLLSALVGMAAGGLLIWTIRIIGTNVLGREAMGFGDVTLMAMIGTFLGWQSCLVIFFLAPFYALGIGLLRLILHAEREIPYGPFLCLAALTLLVRWNAVWGRLAADFGQLGLWIPLVVLVCMVLMAAMLGIWRLILGAFGR